MLHCVPAFVGGYGCGSHAAAVVHVVAKVYRFVLWIVVVGKLAVYLGNAHLIQAILLKHGLRNLCAAHAAVQWNLAVVCKF